MKGALAVLGVLALPAYQLAVAVAIVFTGSSFTSVALTDLTPASLEPALVGWAVGTTGLVLFAVLLTLFVAALNQLTKAPTLDDS